MRFMVIVKATPLSETGALPDMELLTKMGAFNEEMVKAGIMLAADGLHASSKGARLKFNEGKPAVTDGPFAETKELVAGFWILEVKSKDEAIAWMSRAPFTDEEIEIRQVFDISDFAEVMTPEHMAELETKRARLDARSA